MLALFFALLAAHAAPDTQIADEDRANAEERRDETLRGWLHYAAPAALVGVAGCVLWFVVKRDRDQR